MWIAALTLALPALQAQADPDSPKARPIQSRISLVACTLIARGEGYLVHQIRSGKGAFPLGWTRDTVPSHLVLTRTKTGEMTSLFSEYSYCDMRRRQMCYRALLLGSKVQGLHLFIFGWTARQWDRYPRPVHPTQQKAAGLTRFNQSFFLRVVDLPTGKTVAVSELVGDAVPPVDSLKDSMKAFEGGVRIGDYDYRIIEGKLDIKGKPDSSP